MWMSQNTFDDKSTLVQAMAWCRCATSHYLFKVDPGICHHTASLGHNELTFELRVISNGHKFISIAAFLLSATLGVPLQPWEIGRSHRVGKPRNDGTPRPILVKFISYNVRHRIYEARKLIKDIPSLKRKVYFNEDLTRLNGKLAFEARQMKKTGPFGRHVHARRKDLCQEIH